MAAHRARASYLRSTLPAMRRCCTASPAAADGGYPLAGVISDSKGNLYGTTNGGGASNAGVVFKIDTSGHETVLYSFTGGADGGYPLWVTLARDSPGNSTGPPSVAAHRSRCGVQSRSDWQ